MYQLKLNAEFWAILTRIFDMQINRDFNHTHPALISSIKKIQKEIIDSHNFPMKIFETSRNQERQTFLLEKG